MQPRTKKLLAAVSAIAIAVGVTIGVVFSTQTHQLPSDANIDTAPDLWAFHGDVDFRGSTVNLGKGHVSCKNTQALVNKFADHAVSEIDLPLPDGTLAHFRVMPNTNDVLPPALAAKYPLIQTYHGVASVPGQGVVHVNLDSNPDTGIHLQFHGPGWIGYLDPVKEVDEVYKVYFQSKSNATFERPAPDSKFECHTTPEKNVLLETASTNDHRTLQTCREDWLGDGYCDASLNNAACNYDGGDCCDASSNFDICQSQPSLCTCLDPAYQLPSQCDPAVFGNGQCNVVNNNEECLFDGGDCCLSVNDFSTCATDPENCRCLNTDTYAKTYRMAMVASRAYSNYHGGTKSSVLAAVTTAMNRVNGVYMRSIGVRFQLVDYNDDLFELTGNTLINGQGVEDQVADFITRQTMNGPDTYDIGHAFVIGSGGYAPGRVCSDGKHRAFTGLENPDNDGFYIDFVAHEIGHQLSGRHLHNGNNGNCQHEGGKFQVEPGSGSTIMAYAGICGADNVQTASDAYFGVVSLNQMRTYTRNPRSGGSKCGTLDTTKPLPSPEFKLYNTIRSDECVIPKRTPFELYTSKQALFPGSNPSQQYHFNWEQVDYTSRAYALSEHPDNGPLFKSQLPQLEPKRTFPSMENLLDGYSQTSFSYSSLEDRVEQLPKSARTMKFALIARTSFDLDGENVQGSPYGMYYSDTMQVRVSNAGPLMLNSVSVTDPKAVTVSWTANGVEQLADRLTIKAWKEGQPEDAIVVADNVLTTSRSASVDLNQVCSSVGSAISVRVVVEGEPTNGCKFFDLSSKVTFTCVERTESPTLSPTTLEPTASPTTPEPTTSPTASVPTTSPTTSVPTASPTTSPTTSVPTASPTTSPTTSVPTASPTTSPTMPTAFPTVSPTTSPTSGPTASPTNAPTASPTNAPTASPTSAPTTSPTNAPTASPTSAPTNTPTASPTTPETTASPTTSKPTASPTSAPTNTPTASPTTPETTASPTTSKPTASPTTSKPTASPTTSKPTASSDEENSGKTVGIVVGVLAALAVVAAVFFFRTRSKQGVATDEKRMSSLMAANPAFVPDQAGDQRV